MSGFITDSRLSRIITLPVSMPETELKAGSGFHVSTLTLQRGQRMEIRSLSIKVVSILTSGVTPVHLFDAYGLCVIGVYKGSTDCTPLVYASSLDSTAVTSNPFQRAVITSPGTYRVVARNCTSNVDLAVVGTGSVRLFY